MRHTQSADGLNRKLQKELDAAYKELEKQVSNQNVFCTRSIRYNIAIHLTGVQDEHND
jgi:hypothetical protein